MFEWGGEAEETQSGKQRSCMDRAGALFGLRRFGLMDGYLRLHGAVGYAAVMGFAALLMGFRFTHSAPSTAYPPAWQ